MPSIFSRSRTNSTPNKKPSFITPLDAPVPTLDEFGRVSSRVSGRNVLAISTPSKKDLKKKAKEQEKRSKTLASTREFSELDHAAAESAFPDGTFLPLNLERPKPTSEVGERSKDHDYGYLSYERHVVLGLEQAARLVDVLSDELETRGGTTTPFIFSTTALDISSSAIKRLIQTFLNTCAATTGHALNEAEHKWREEARFAGPHELGMCLRWGLARVIRSVAGQDVRGLVSWDHYVEFRDSEAALGYPPTHFEVFLVDLVPELQSIILRVLNLITRLTANSTSSGHTPPTLSPLFGPLLFGLGPATLTFHHAYVHYLRSVHAMEHLVLAFIRWQDTPRMVSPSGSRPSLPSGSASTLGVPARLKEWIIGYPAMLPFLNQSKNAKPEPRKGARIVRVMSVRRNVRMYSPDLVKTASTWAYRRPGAGTNTGLAASKEWDRIAPATLKLPPRYSEAYKKRMDMPTNFHPDTGPGAYGVSLSASTSSTMSSATATTSSLLGDSDYFGLGSREGEDKYRNLTDLKWGEFESMGFGGLGDEKKLQFDLTESARTQRTAKRATLSWNDFSSSGFTRTDGSLSATLEFSAPISNTVSAWPEQNAELSKKLKKTQKALPAFGWDTEPVIGSEEVIEEAFVDVFCDLVYGGGWMDLERGEELDRDCNWAMVEYKSLPPSRTTATGGSDPRTSTTLVLFEEFVPLEYRQQLAFGPSTRRRLPSLFSASKAKPWKQAATLNGRPYVVGHVPRSPSYREVEFEGLLHGGTATKVISLGSRNHKDNNNTPSRIQSQASQAPQSPAGRMISSPLYIPEPEQPTTARSEEMHSDSTVSPSVKRMSMSRFKLPGGIPVPSPGGIRKTGMAPSEYSTVEFETRMASYSDDEHNGMEEESVKQKRRESKDDAWVDILVNSHARRMGGQEAELPAERKRGVRNRRSDPDLASLEVAQVLAAVQNRSPSPPSVHMPERVDRDYGMDHHVEDMDEVDEIETVPRTSEAQSADVEDEEAVLAYREEPDVEYEEEEEVLPHSESKLAQRRLGYFDLHPDRRPPKSSLDDDPRAKFAADDSDDDDEPARVAAAAHIRPLPVPPNPTAPSPIASSPDDDIIARPLPVETKRPEPERALPLPPIPTAQGNGNGNGSISEKPTSTPTSKTAALIEMYRERERGASPQPTAPPPAAVPVVIVPLPPSRLPVRSASLPKEPVPLPEEPVPLPKEPVPLPKKPVPLPATPSPQSLTPSPKPSPRPSPPDDVPTELPQVPFVEPGRASPMRYIHGAPLHNVLEEEEED